MELNKEILKGHIDTLILAILEKKDSYGFEIAKNVLDEIVKIGQNSRGLKTKLGTNGKDYFGFIREVNAPSVIVECAFVDNKTDIKIIDTTAEQKKMGVAIAKGILKTLGIAYKTQATVLNDKPSGKTYKVQVGAFANKSNAEKLKKELKSKGYNAVIVTG